MDCNSLLFNTPATHIYQDSAIRSLYDFVKGAIRRTCSRKHLLVTPRASVSMITLTCILVLDLVFNFYSYFTTILNVKFICLLSVF